MPLSGATSGFLIALGMHNNWLPFVDWSQVPFLDRMGWVFVICVIGMFILSYVLPDEKQGLEVDASMFRAHKSFMLGAAVILVLLVFLYSYFW
ncbi:hypothetical protein [Dyadobacter bucti]|uniref:hypothetical protein n=1 Tax=Dyadobacter bucti TaxID=2572203 RepID=UPI00140DFE2E|nr:hypothetical protein [Dyadobacter bucti]